MTKQGRVDWETSGRQGRREEPAQHTFWYVSRHRSAGRWIARWITTNATLFRWLLAACFMIALPACAAQTTAMVECPAAGCPSTAPIDPISAELNRVASRELECEASKIQFKATADADDSNGPWEARGCGRATVYRNSRGIIERTALIANTAK